MQSAKQSTKGILFKNELLFLFRMKILMIEKWSRSTHFSSTESTHTVVDWFFIQHFYLFEVLKCFLSLGVVGESEQAFQEVCVSVYQVSDLGWRVLAFSAQGRCILRFTMLKLCSCLSLFLRDIAVSEEAKVVGIAGWAG